MFLKEINWIYLGVERLNKHWEWRLDLVKIRTRASPTLIITSSQSQSKQRQTLKCWTWSLESSCTERWSFILGKKKKTETQAWLVMTCHPLNSHMETILENMRGWILIWLRPQIGRCMCKCMREKNDALNKFQGLNMEEMCIKNVFLNGLPYGVQDRVAPTASNRLPEGSKSHPRPSRVHGPQVQVTFCNQDDSRCGSKCHNRLIYYNQGQNIKSINEVRRLNVYLHWSSKPVQKYTQDK